MKALLGPPLRVLHGASDPGGGLERWVFADSPTGGSHDVRVVVFSRAGLVVKAYAGYDLG